MDARLRLLAVLLAGVVAAESGAGQTTGVAEWRGIGVVLAVLPPPSSLHATRPVIVIEHGPIAGLMDETMSMPFIVESARLLEAVRPGDRISFRLRDTPDALLVISVERLPSGGDRPAARPR